jgi:ABC-type uncharacterized transport system involved in gliding motility auxiliary subunit
VGRGLKRCLKRRQTRYGVEAALSVILMLGILAAILGISQGHYWRWDLTANRRYSLSSQTIQLLEGLDEPVRAIAFYQQEDPARQSVADLLDLYSHHSGMFSWEFVDPDRFPMRAQRYNVDNYHTVVMEAKGRFEKAFTADEESLTNALLRVTRSTKPVVYYLQGHGEHGLDDYQRSGYRDLKKAMEAENYEVRPVFLARRRGVPPDADVVLLAGPKKDLQEEEWRALSDYISRGGSLMVLAEPYSPDSLREFLSRYGIEVGKDVVVDQQSRVLGGDYLVPPVVDYAFHPITQQFRKNPLLTYLMVACSVRPAEKRPDGVDVEVLARTGPGSWAERDLDRLKEERTAEEDPKVDIPGPVPVAVVGTYSPPDAGPQARIVVIGDSDFVTNSAMDPSRSANRDFFLNALDWLSGQEDLISIRPRPTVSNPIVLKPHQLRLLFWGVVVAFPAMILLAGAVVLWMRRRRG